MSLNEFINCRVQSARSGSFSLCTIGNCIVEEDILRDLFVVTFQFNLYLVIGMLCVNEQQFRAFNGYFPGVALPEGPFCANRLGQELYPVKINLTIFFRIYEVDGNHTGGRDDKNA